MRRLLFASLILVASCAKAQECERPYIEPALGISASMNKSFFNVDAMGGITLRSPRIFFLGGVKSYNLDDVLTSSVVNNKKFYSFSAGKEKFILVGTTGARLWISDDEVVIPYVTLGKEYWETGIRFNMRAGDKSTIGFIINRNKYYKFGCGLNFFGSLSAN